MPKFDFRNSGMTLGGSTRYCFSCQGPVRWQAVVHDLPNTALQLGENRSMNRCPTTPLHLYAYLLRKIRLLPPHMQGHYKHEIRQHFNSHADENDPRRINEIMSKAIQDMDWIVKKHT
uniref:LYR motif-containing protein 9 n=1 Tax=Trichobilharzia regenti TaxID=157069 RepID=A0AA85JS01_TRIRE|nr:unnamed protein product [Trichobilharzia regenti]